jgi:aspartyl-tRNA(Asn)/glutamyl-tRNA(Gln) amidotransferase subunit C
MIVNDELIDNLAELACLEFTAAEKEELKKDLGRMINFIDKLNELDTTGIEPQLHMSEEINTLRADVLEGSVSREEALKNAPLTDGIFFKVPKVIKNPAEKNDTC